MVKKIRKARPLVLGYLERISIKAFSDFRKQLTDLVGTKHGIYALYKGDRLYYVGLATNLRNRIPQHLKDRHAKRWDRFSLYLVRKEDHIKEIESLLLRIADPTGNATRGRLSRSENLQPELLKKIKAEQEKQLGKLFGSKARPIRRKKPKTRKRTFTISWGTCIGTLCQKPL